MKKTLTLILPTLVCALLLVPAALLQGGQVVVAEKGTIDLPVSVDLHVQVVRGGRVVEERVKVGDPLVRNMWNYIANAFFGRYSNNPLPLYRTDGSTVSAAPEWGCVRWNDGTFSSDFFPWNSIRLGTSTTAVSFTDQNIRGTEIATFTVPRESSSYSVTDNGTHIIITFTGTWTSTGSYTIGEVALSATTPSSGGNQPTYGWFWFIARDVLSPTISVASNDTVIVTYTLRIRYNVPPMTRNFAILIANYMTAIARLPDRRLNFTTVDGTSTWRYDVGEEQSIYPYDDRKDGLLICLTDYNGSYDPMLYNVPRRTCVSLATPPGSSPPPQVGYTYNSTHVTYSYTIDITVQEAFIARGIAVFLEPVDIDTTCSASPSTGILILYFPLSSPRPLSPGQRVRFSFSITFRWA